MSIEEKLIKKLTQSRKDAKSRKGGLIASVQNKFKIRLFAINFSFLRELYFSSECLKSISV